MLSTRRAPTAVLLAVLAPLAVAVASGPTAAAPAPQATRAPSAAAAADPGKLLLVLDASGSMKEPDPSGMTKMQAAKAALTDVVDALADDATVGLRVYGDRSDSCRDSRLVAPIDTLDRPGLKQAIRRTVPTGETPIAYSLQQAAEDLGDTGRRTIVLVSDGEETCAPDPCKVVRDLTGAGVDLRVDAVGFGVGAKARGQLQCIADASGGDYYDASDARALGASLGKLSQRAVRPFTVTGTPVTAGATPEEAPALEPGQYTDTLAADAAAGHYELVRSPGSTVRFSVTTRPPRNAEHYNQELVRLEVTTPEGETCDSEAGTRFDPGGLSEVVVTHARVAGPEPTAATATEEAEPCAVADRLRVSLLREAEGGRPVPVELVFLEEPPVTELDGLPAALDPAAVEPLTAPADGAGTPVVGGGGFSDALALAPGTYQETVLPGEQLFYRVPLEHGQRAAFTVDAPAPGERVELDRTSYVAFDLSAWGPSRADLSLVSGVRGSLGPSGESQLLSTYVPEVRYLNREAMGNGSYSYVRLREVSIAGDHYFALARAAEDPGSDAAVPVTVRIRVAVEGEPTGGPEYAAGEAPAGAAPSPSPSTESPSADAEEQGEAASADAADDDRSLVPWLVGGAALVALLAAAIALLVRRRRT